MVINNMRCGLAVCFGPVVVVLGQSFPLFVISIRLMIPGRHRIVVRRRLFTYRTISNKTVYYTTSLPQSAVGRRIGRNGKILVGGAGPEDDNKSKDKPRNASDLEAVFYHALPLKTDQEWHHSCGVCSTVSLATGPFNDALACLLLRKPYFGITLTDTHSRLGVQWLTKQVWKAFITEGSGLYEPELAAIVKDSEDDDGGEGGGDDDGGGDGGNNNGGRGGRGRGGRGRGGRGRGSGSKNTGEDGAGGEDGGGRGGRGRGGGGGRGRGNGGSGAEGSESKADLLKRIAALTGGEAGGEDGGEGAEDDEGGEGASA